MLAPTLSLLLCLASMSASALSNDVPGAVGARLLGQEAESAVDRKLSGYLDEDDIVGAKAFVDGLAIPGDVTEAERRALEDRIWRTKAERMLDYARKIREAIAASDLDTMRDYNARMQRLTAGTEPVQEDSADSEEDAAASGPDAGAEADLPDGETTESAAQSEPDDPARVDAAEVDPIEDSQEGEDSLADRIAELTGRGEAAMAAYHLTIAPPGTASALDMVDQLKALGGAGEEAARALGDAIMTLYDGLIERDIARGRLDKARAFALRMREVAERAGLPDAHVDTLSALIDRAGADREEHDRLLRETVRLRNQGRLVAPAADHALASAAKTLKLGVDPSAAEDALDDVIDRQRKRAGRLAEAGRLRDGARELEMLADGLLEADVGRAVLVADLRTEAASLYRRADRLDSERERQAATSNRPAEAPSDDDDGSPFTFINPF